MTCDLISPNKSRFCVTLALWLSACSLAVGQTPDAPPGNTKAKEPPAADTAEKPVKRELDLSTPRAVVQEFLLAIQDADGDHPERIADAVACLDTSELEGDDVTEQAQRLARRLYAVMNPLDIQLEDVPAETAETQITLHEVGPAEGKPRAEIRLARDLDTGQWRFTPSTLASIPILSKTAPAEKPSPAETAIPAARRSAMATMRSFLDAMNAKPKPNWAEAIQCLDPTGTAPDAWPVTARNAATQIKNVMDKTKIVVLASIPGDPDGEPYEFYSHKLGSIVIGPVADDVKDAAGTVLAQKGEWRFTPRTLATLDALYEEFEDKPILSDLKELGIEERLTLGLRLQRLVPDWARNKLFGLQLWKWLGLVALLGVGWLVKRLAAAVATLIGAVLLRHRRISVERKVQRRAFRSFGGIAMALFWWYAVDENILQLTDWLLTGLVPLTKFGLAASVGWFGYRLVDVLGMHIASNPEMRLTHFDDLLIPLLRTILRFVVWVVVILFVLKLFGVETRTVLGALGIGGVALAFAAKDTLGNFFGSLTVLFDRPFGIGDWVEIGGMHGTVEHVGFRSTRVRTFYNSIVSIPNSEVANTKVDNYGARRYRRAKTTLSVTYNTPPEKLDAFCEGVRELVRLHPYTRKDYYHVYFNDFGPSSLDILLYVFFDTPDWSTELRERHRLFSDILRLAEKLGVEFAFPTRTVWLERPGKQAADSESTLPHVGLEAEQAGIDTAAAVFEETYGSEPDKRGYVVIDRTPKSRRDEPKSDA